jgi:putative SOS response-associated peptidase YedK
MCGRYLLTSPGNLIQVLFQLDEAPTLTPRFNAAPSQHMPVIRVVDDARCCDLLQWGLVPFWAKDPSIAHKLINARCETAAQKPSFRDAMKTKRCLVPADGFYEWQPTGQGARKQPWVFRMADEAPFAMAGLWAQCVIEDVEWQTFTILTTRSNTLVAPIHRRMPVIVDPKDFDVWLDAGVDGGACFEQAQLGVPWPSDGMSGRPVSTYVNKPLNDDSGCLASP